MRGRDEEIVGLCVWHRENSGERGKSEVKREEGIGQNFQIF